MGMLGYALSDKEGAKAMLFKRYSEHVTIENLLYTCFFWKKYVEVRALFYLILSFWYNTRFLH